MSHVSFILVEVVRTLQRMGAMMGLDASVRCRCFEEGRLRPGPVPTDDLYINEEGYLSSRKLDAARAKYSLRQFLARYYDLDVAFSDWQEHPCEHDGGAICDERVGDISDVSVFEGYCAEIGEDKLPVLSHIIPDCNGGTFPAELAKEALCELDYFDSWLNEKMASTYVIMTLIDASTGQELWNDEGESMPLFVNEAPAEAYLANCTFYVVNNKNELLFSSKNFVYELYESNGSLGQRQSDLEPDSHHYTLTCLETGVSIECRGGFEFCNNEEQMEFVTCSREAWPHTVANIALRKLLVASAETGNPIRWC